ncbi:hypothetical protein ACH5RR_003745 [Cinchona calisaya]|uniref:Uncharacterized protein n=1 Tax=Cinchona calisaya TaxID=153742 RepID=A0ABD3AVQ6_9GENT
MGKKVVYSVPIHKKTLTKRDNKKKKLLLKLKKVLDFLKSDNYMFAPLVSPQASDHFVSSCSTTSTGIEANEPFKEKREELFEKVKDYMKSDCYMYAPLVIHQPWLRSSVPAVNSATEHARRMEHSLKNVAKEAKDQGQKVKSISFAEQLVDGRPYAGSTVIKHTLLQQETVKHVIKQNCRSSAVQGKGLLGANARKLV